MRVQGRLPGRAVRRVTTSGEVLTVAVSVDPPDCWVDPAVEAGI